MKNRLLLTAILTAPLVMLVGCGPSDEVDAPVAVEAAPVARPAEPTDSQGWKLYIMDVVKRNMAGVTSSPFTYYLPDASVADFDAQYERQLENVQNVVLRGVLPGNMLAFGSPASTRMADLVVQSFEPVSEGSFKDVKVLYIGDAADRERVAAAVAPSGATLIFVETK